MFEDIYKSRRVFITGHTGFKGSWLTEWLLKLGAEVCGYSNGIPTEPAHFNVLKLAPRITHLVGDIRNLAQLKEAIEVAQPEVVFHLAAQPIVSSSISNPLETFETNLMGTVNVLEALKNAPSVKAAVFITSDKCYENVEWEYGYRETDRIGGKDPYSSSKGCAEIAFHSYFRTYYSESPALRMATARAGNVIGGGDWAKDRVIPDCARAWGSGSNPSIRSPHATRPWQHVLEPLSGYLWLAAKLLSGTAEANGESFNFGPAADTNHTVERLLQQISVTWGGKSWETAEMKLTKKEAGLLKLNCDKSLHRLGWLPTLDFEETAAMTAAWYKNYYAGDQGCQLTRLQIEHYEAIGRDRSRIWTR